jgi:hypothetical protein
MPKIRDLGVNRIPETQPLDTGVFEMGAKKKPKCDKKHPATCGGGTCANASQCTPPTVGGKKEKAIGPEDIALLRYQLQTKMDGH